MLTVWLALTGWWIRNVKYLWYAEAILSHWNWSCLTRPSQSCLIHLSKSFWNLSQITNSFVISWQWVCSSVVSAAAAKAGLCYLPYQQFSDWLCIWCPHCPWVYDSNGLKSRAYQYHAKIQVVYILCVLLLRVCWHWHSSWSKNLWQLNFFTLPRKSLNLMITKLQKCSLKSKLNSA